MRFIAMTISGESGKRPYDSKPGVHERKWEIDSLCYPIRLAYAYWKQTGDATPFDADERSRCTTLNLPRTAMQRGDVPIVSAYNR
jgi:meiotically up-regulated gene 157 (Mug157) protein